MSISNPWLWVIMILIIIAEVYIVMLAVGSPKNKIGQALAIVGMYAILFPTALWLIMLMKGTTFTNYYREEYIRRENYSKGYNDAISKKFEIVYTSSHDTLYRKVDDKDKSKDKEK